MDVANDSVELVNVWCEFSLYVDITSATLVTTMATPRSRKWRSGGDCMWNRCRWLGGESSSKPCICED